MRFLESKIIEKARQGTNLGEILADSVHRGRSCDGEGVTWE